MCSKNYLLLRKLDLRCQGADLAVVALIEGFGVFFKDLEHLGVHEALAVNVAILADGFSGDADFADPCELARSGGFDDGAQALRGDPNARWQFSASTSSQSPASKVTQRQVRAPRSVIGLCHTCKRPSMTP